MLRLGIAEQTCNKSHHNKIIQIYHNSLILHIYFLIANILQLSEVDSNNLKIFKKEKIRYKHTFQKVNFYCFIN